MESGDHVEAEVQFRHALALDPTNENAAVNLGLLLAKQRRYDAALAVLIPAVGESAAHHNIGVVAIDGGDEVTAKAAFARAARPALPAQSNA